MTEPQRNAFSHSWGKYGLDLNDGLRDLATEFGRPADTVFEIGFGMGDSLLQMCINEPEKNFVGVEVHPPGVGRLINEAGKVGIRNLRVYMADASDVLNECMADSSLTRIQIYFPDPWPKKKHHKRRIVQAPLLELCSNCLLYTSPSPRDS